MIDFFNKTELCRSTSSKIVMLVVDGLGGLPNPSTGKSELETAVIPNLDLLAQKSDCGLTTPVLPGITPGSGPGHTALFGYDPSKYLVGRGVLEALGIGIDLSANDIAARCNFCTIDTKTGALIDRRANRIASDESRQLVNILNEIDIPGIDISVYPGKDYRFVAVISGQGLESNLKDTDPVPPNQNPSPVIAIDEYSKSTANALNIFLEKSKTALSNQNTANMILMRGFSKLPHWPQINEIFKFRSAAIAAYPMYRGLSKLIGMDILDGGEDFDQEMDALYKNYSSYDFFFLHYKPADAAGEDGDFATKVEALEKMDSYIPDILKINPDVLVIAGDHSTPSVYGNHSWHTVPFIVNSKYTRGGTKRFNEQECSSGSAGHIPASSLMSLAMAHAGKLAKNGP